MKISVRKYFTTNLIMVIGLITAAPTAHADPVHQVIGDPIGDIIRAEKQPTKTHQEATQAALMAVLAVREVRLALRN